MIAKIFIFAALVMVRFKRQIYIVNKRFVACGTWNQWPREMGMFVVTLNGLVDDIAQQSHYKSFNYNPIKSIFV